MNAIAQGTCVQAICQNPSLEPEAVTAPLREVLIMPSEARENRYLHHTRALHTARFALWALMSDGRDDVRDKYSPPHRRYYRHFLRERDYLLSGLYRNWTSIPAPITRILGTCRQIEEKNFFRRSTGSVRSTTND